MFGIDIKVIEAIIGLLSLTGIIFFNVEKLRKWYSLIMVMVMLLRFYKHIAPMAKHYFDTHPIGKKLKKNTKVDNKINHLIATHQLPYDKDKLHDELAKKGAQG